MKHLFIVNPASRDLQSLNEKIRDACASLDYTIIQTEHAGHAAEIARRTAEECYDVRIYVCGGDGTLNEAINGVAGKEQVSVSHIPTGTGNDFIRCFGSKEDFLDIEALINGQELSLDLIEVEAGGQKRFALNICSAGVDADVAAGVERYKWARRWGSKMPYNLSLVITTLKGVKRPYKVTVDGQSFEGDFTILTCCNGQVYGGGFKACPDSDPTDGQMEFLLVRGMSRLTLTRIIGDYGDGKYKEMTDYIRHIQGQRMTIEAREPVNINYDGEIVRADRVSFTTSPHKLRFVVPAKVFDTLWYKSAARLSGSGH